MTATAACGSRGEARFDLGRVGEDDAGTGEVLPETEMVEMRRRKAAFVVEWPLLRLEYLNISFREF